MTVRRSEVRRRGAKNNTYQRCLEMLGSALSGPTGLIGADPADQVSAFPPAQAAGAKRHNCTALTVKEVRLQNSTHLSVHLLFLKTRLTVAERTRISLTRQSKLPNSRERTSLLRLETVIITQVIFVFVDNPRSTDEYFVVAWPIPYWYSYIATRHHQKS